MHPPFIHEASDFSETSLKCLSLRSASIPVCSYCSTRTRCLIWIFEDGVPAAGPSVGVVVMRSASQLPAPHSPQRRAAINTVSRHCALCIWILVLSFDGDKSLALSYYATALLCAPSLARSSSLHQGLSLSRQHFMTFAPV